MEDQMTVRLPREMGDALRKRAARNPAKPSELIRMAVMKKIVRPPTNRRNVRPPEPEI